MKIFSYIFLPLVILLCFPSFTFPNVNNLDGVFNIFTTQKTQISNTTSTDSGMGYIIKGNVNWLNSTLYQLNTSQIRGISIEGNAIDISKITKKLDITPIETEKLNNISCTYGYCPHLPLYTIVDNHRINIQITQTGDYVKVGYPLILDGA